MQTGIDPRAVQTLTADMTKASAYAVIDLVAEAGMESRALDRLLAIDFVEARHGELIGEQVSSLRWQLGDGIYMTGTGTYTDDHDLTIEAFTALTKVHPWEYLLAAAELIAA